MKLRYMLTKEGRRYRRLVREADFVESIVADQTIPNDPEKRKAEVRDWARMESRSGFPCVRR
jgi:hypothetical protein